MPKPLLSGYFTNNLNSVRNVNEVQKSLEEMGDLDDMHIVSKEGGSPTVKRLDSDMMFE